MAFRSNREEEKKNLRTALRDNTQMSLEARLDAEFEQLKVAQKDRISIRSELEILKRKHQGTYEHSIRVGLLAASIGKFMHLDRKALLFAGLLHDMGKALVDPALLKKTEGFSQEDMAQMQSHPVGTYNLLRGIFDFTAEVAVRHHTFQEHRYPKSLPSPSHNFSAGTQATVAFYARIISLTDFYDAASTRENDKFGSKKLLSPDEVKELMLKKNPDQIRLIEELYRNSIFTPPDKVADNAPK